MEIERLRSKGEIGLRVPDTNVAMQNSSFIYLLSGNLHKVPEYNEAGEDSLASELFFRFKKPHDILLTRKLFRELDNIKDNPRKQPEDQAKARYAQKSISGFLKSSDFYGDFETAKGVRQGEVPITLENGANVYIMDVTKDDVVNYLDESWDPPNDDMIFVATTLKFLERNPFYKHVRFISDDIGAGNSASFYGIQTDSFRFREVRNPLQNNPGLYETQVSLTAGRKLLSKPVVSVNDSDCGLFFDESFFSSNNVLQISVGDGRKKEGEIKFTDYRVYDKKKKELRQLNFYEEFLDFFLNRMYSSEQKKEDKITNIEYNPKLNGHLPHFAGIVDSLYENRLISEGEYTHHQKMIDSYNRSKKKKSNKQKKLRELFSDLENRGLIFPEGGRAPVQTYEDILELPFNNYLYPQGQQKPFLDHLLNPDIGVLSVDAKGGFGKTLWALVAGLYMVNQGKYEKILYLGSLATAEGDIGFRKGDKAAKIHDKIQPAKRALREIFTDYSKIHPEHKTRVEDFVSTLENDGIIEYDVIVDIKGSTYRQTYGIVDECHLYNLDEMGLILGRFGHGSKVVALSAMEQLRSSTKVGRHLNERSSGVAHMAEKLPIFDEYAHISVSEDEIYRGLIPVMAAELTKMRLI
ncbi:MAG: PhoH family protein [Candidatus Woesearchaeota archaeon]